MSEKQQQHKKKPTPNQTKKYSLYKKTKQKKQLNDFKFSYFEYSAWKKGLDTINKWHFICQYRLTAIFQDIQGVQNY